MAGCDSAGAGNGNGIGSLFTGWPMGRMIYFYVIHLFFMPCLALLSPSSAPSSLGLCGLCVFGAFYKSCQTYADSWLPLGAVE